MDTCVCTTESLYYVSETNTVSQLYSNVKFTKKSKVALRFENHQSNQYFQCPCPVLEASTSFIYYSSALQGHQ